MTNIEVSACYIPLVAVTACGGLGYSPCENLGVAAIIRKFHHASWLNCMAIETRVVISGDQFLSFFGFSAGSEDWRVKSEGGVGNNRRRITPLRSPCTTP